MPQRRIQYKPGKKGFVQQVTLPLEANAKELEAFVKKMKNPPAAIRKFWPPNLK